MCTTGTGSTLQAVRGNKTKQAQRQAAKDRSRNKIIQKGIMGKNEKWPYNG